MEQELERLAQLFIKFPGIGQRQAKRFAYFILTQSDQYINSLSASILKAHRHAKTCPNCYRIFEGDNKLCNICLDESRDHSTIIVVEKSQDIDSFYKTDYDGIFFVIGRLIPIIQKNNLKNTNLELLLQKIKSSSDSIKEIILAFPVTPNGENTDMAVRESIKKIDQNIKISSLGRGLSSGAELEYADTESLSASLKKRE